MRLWTGFMPSRTSGRAREMMTDIEYSRKERLTSFSIETSVIR